MINRVIQKHENGCVSACIAMLANVSYVQGVRLTHPYRTSYSHLGATLAGCLAALKRAGFSFRKRNKKTNFNKLKRDALIIINSGDYDHAIIWDHEAQKIRDPYPSRHRRMKRHWPQNSYQKRAIHIIEVYK